MLLYNYKLKIFIFFIRTIYINNKGPEKNSLFLEAYLDLSWFRYDTYIHKIWDKDLDLNLNNFFISFKNLKKITELFNLSLNLLYKFKFTIIIFSKLYKILYNLIQNIKYYNFINIIDNLDVQIEQILLINPIINNKLILLLVQLNHFKDIISKIKIINLKQIKLILKQFLLKHKLILYIFYNKILHLEVFDDVELCSKKTFFFYIINDMLNFLYLSIFKNRINILNYNFYNYPYYNFIYYVYDFFYFFFTIYNIIDKICFIKLNIISHVNKLINTIIFFQTYLLNNINLFFSFKESKLELLNIILFLELFFLCCSFIAVVDINFDNFYLKCLNFIKINYFELLNLLEFMCTNILKKKYYFFNIYISNLIKNFLTDINLFKLYLIKYYNLIFIKIIKSVYLKSYIVTIKVLMSLYNFNLSLNILNDSIEFIKLVRSLTVSKLKRINYLFNLFYNLSYYFDSIIQNLNYIFLISLKQYEKNKLVVNLENNLDLIKPTPYKNQMSMEELGEQVQLKILNSKRSKPRNLTIYQTNSLIELGVLEPKKKLTKKELYEDEWGVSWEFAQNNKDYMSDVSDYITRRNLRRQNRLINNKIIKKKSLRGKPSKIKIESKYDLYYLHNQTALNINLSLLYIQDFNIFLYFKIMNNFKIFNHYRNNYLVKNYKLRKYKKKNV